MESRGGKNAEMARGFRELLGGIEGLVDHNSIYDENLDTINNLIASFMKYRKTQSKEQQVRNVVRHAVISHGPRRYTPTNVLRALDETGYSKSSWFAEKFTKANRADRERIINKIMRIKYKL